MSARTSRSALPLTVALVLSLLVVVEQSEPTAAAVGDDFLESESFALSLTPGTTDAAGRAALTTPGVPLPNEPEMLIIDTAGTAASFSLRSQSQAGDWSDWIEVSAEADESPDGLAGEEGSATTVGAIGPIWLGDDAAALEIVLTSDAPVEVTIESLNSTDTRPAPVAAQTANLGTGQPPIMSRSAWATQGWRPEHTGCDGGPFLAENVRTVVVHHTVTTNNYSADQVDDLLRAIYRLHADTNGWCDIAYNFVVDRFGTIWQARSGGIDQPVIGGHSKGFNTWTVGVALLGQHQAGASPAAATPTSASVAAVQSLAAWKLALHGVDPLGTSWLKNRSSRPPHKYPAGEFVSVPTIVGHRDLGLTSCPGSLTVPSIAPIRSVLADAHNVSPPPIPTGRVPEPGPALMTVDASGGIRADVAATPTPSPSIPGGTSAIAIAGRAGRGQVLLSNGSLAPFGGATAISGQPAGGRRVVDLSAGANGNQGWVLEEDGRIYQFGGAAERTAPTKPAAGQALALGLASNGRGYILDRSGRLFAVDGVPARSIGSSVAAVDIALRPDGVSGWVLDTSGRLHPFGGAPDWQPELTVTDPRALAVGGTFGGWVLDSEGRLIRFGDERRANPVSTTVGSADIVDVGLLDWYYGEDTDDVRFAAALLELFLAEVPSAALADHYGFLIDETTSGEVIIELSQSEAWAGKLIDELYRDVLGRAADPAGRQYWLDQIRGGLRTQDLGALFYGSQEYVTSSGSTSSYVRRLYGELLGRTPDSAGLDFWVALLDSGRSTPPEVTLGFYQSPESRSRRVVGLYDEILLRPPDPAGLAYWAGELLSIDDIALAQELAGSQEFYDRVVG